MSWFQTLRGRLTLWNLVVIAATLSLYGVLMSFTTQKRLALDVNRELMDRAQRFAHGPPDMPPPAPGRRMQLRRGPDAMDLRHPQYYDETGALTNGFGDEQPYDADLVGTVAPGQGVFADVDYRGVPIRVFALNVPFGPRGGGTVETAVDLTAYKTLVRQQMTTLLIILPIALLVAGLGAVFLTNAALRPIGEVTEAAAQITEMNLSQRLPVRGKDELAQLSSTFNAMFDRLQAAFAKLTGAYANLEAAYENQKRFTADASHELRTPLTRLRLATSSAVGQDDPKALAESMKVADQAGAAMSTIVEELLLLARADSGNFTLNLTDQDLRVIAAEAVDSCTSPARITLKLPERQVIAKADSDHLKRVVVNLLENALRHTPEGKSILVRVYPRCIEVSDEGEGISSEHLPHLGERFYRVDAARSRAQGGFGLGLAICRSIVEAHHGGLTFESEVGRGTRAVVSLPA